MLVFLQCDPDVKCLCICCILNKPLSESGSSKYTRRNDGISKHENHNYLRFLLTFILLSSRGVFIKVRQIRTYATMETIGILITMKLLRSSGTGLYSISGAKPLRVPMKNIFPDSKVHGANMGPICGRQDPGGPHVGPIESQGKHLCEMILKHTSLLKKFFRKCYLRLPYFGLLGWGLKLRPRQNGCRIPDDIFKNVFLHKHCCI